MTGSRALDEAVYQFNCDTKSWSQPRIQGQSDVVARYGHQACVIDARMFVFGGRSTDDGYLNDVVVLDSSAGVKRWQVASTGAQHS